MKTKLLYYLFFMIILMSCQDKENLLNEETDTTPAGLMATPSKVVEINEPDISLNGDYCATVSINDPEAKSASKHNLTVKVEKGYLKEIRNEDHTVIQDFRGVFFNDDRFTEFQSNGLEYRISILATLEECYSGELKGFSVRCNGITQKGKQCKNRTLHESKLCAHHRE